MFCCAGKNSKFLCPDRLAVILLRGIIVLPHFVEDSGQVEGFGGFGIDFERSDNVRFCPREIL